MGDRRSLGRLAREPLYNTLAVVHATGVPADTFRAWERRYGLPRPFRTPTRQRLYSEQDIGVIRWLRDRTDEGMTISQAIQRLTLEVPEAVVAPRQPEQSATALDTGPAPQTDRLRQRLIDALTAFDTHGADRVVDEALARASVEAFCTQLIEPVVQEISTGVSSGELSIAVQHFGSRLLSRRLAAISTIVTPPAGRGTAIVAGQAGDELEVRLLILAIMLARRGWQIVFLGSNVSTEALVDAADSVRPDLVGLITLTDRSSAHAATISQSLDLALDRPPPVVAGRTATDVIDRIADVIDLR